jgi:hypothetical protein
MGKGVDVDEDCREMVKRKDDEMSEKRECTTCDGVERGERSRERGRSVNRERGNDTEIQGTGIDREFKVAQPRVYSSMRKLKTASEWP